MLSVEQASRQISNVENTAITSATDVFSSLSFKELGIDSRLIKQLEYLNFHQMTLIQRQSIPVGLQKKDILMK